PAGNGTTPPVGNDTTPPVGNDTTPPQQGEMIQLTTSPVGAEVFVDGALAGNTPLTLPKPAAGTERTVEVRLSGYRTQRVMLSSGSPANMSVSLRRSSGGGHGGHEDGHPNIGDVVDPWGT